MDLSKFKFFWLPAIFFFCIISFTTSMILEDRILEDLAPNSKVRYDYTGYRSHYQITNRTDLIIELIPVYQWKIKPKTVKVDDGPLIDLFGKYAAGKVLELDERTQLYKLPPADESVTEEERLKMMWLDKSYVNYCAEHIGKVRLVDKVRTGARVICTDDFYKDRCCGEINKCHCIISTIGCTCISDEAHAKRMKMFNQTVKIGKAIKDEVKDIAAKIAAMYKG